MNETRETLERVGKRFEFPEHSFDSICTKLTTLTLYPCLRILEIRLCAPCEIFQFLRFRTHRFQFLSHRIELRREITFGRWFLRTRHDS